MSKRKIVIAFDSLHFTIFADNRLLLSVPSAVVRKKSAFPVPIAFGSDALIMKDKLTDDQYFCRPFCTTGIDDMQGAKLMIKHYIKSFFRFPYPEIYVLISGGLTPKKRSEIETAFIVCGFKNVFLIEKPYVLAKLSEQTNKNIYVEIGEQNIELTMAKEGKVERSYSIDMGLEDVRRNITEELCIRNELSHLITPVTKGGDRAFMLRSAYDMPLNKCASLYANDYTRIHAVGVDVISGANKTIHLSSKEILKTVQVPYDTSYELIRAVLVECDKDTVQKIVEEGIVYFGAGVKINGFVKYMYDKTQLPVYTEEDEYFLLAKLSGFVMDKRFVELSLGFHA